MSDSSKLRYLKYGTHASTSDWTTMPGSLAFLEPEENVTLDVKPRHVDRGSVQRGNGQRVPRKTVGKLTSGIPDITLALRGLSGSGAGNGVSTSTLTHDLDGILTAIFGSEVEGVGDTFSGTPGTGASFTMDGTASNSGGTGVLILGAASGKYIARQVYAAGGSLGVDRAITEDDGTVDAPEASSVCYGGRVYSLSALVPNRTHFALEAEGDNWRNQFLGCLSSATLSFSPGDYAKITLSGINFTDCSDDDELAVTNPTWATPTRGKLIPVIDCPMWIGAGSSPDTYMTMGGLTIDLGLTIAPRGSSGPNGPFGFVVTGVNPVLRWQMIAGSLTAPKEVTDTILATFRADSVFDCSWQFGRAVGETAYIRAPAINIAAERGESDGMEVINCVGTCTDASEVSTNATDHLLHMILF